MQTQQAQPNVLTITQTKKSNLILAFAICFASTLFGGIVSMLMSVYLPVAVKDLLGNVSDEKLNDVSAYINAMFLYGWMIGGIIWGIICDRIGRAKSVILSTGFYGFFTLLTVVAPSWWIVSICRFMCGFGIGGVLVTTTILVSECWSENKRAIMLGILSVAVPAGFFAAGAINNMLPQWRMAFTLGAVPLLLSLVSIFILPESTIWAEQKKTIAQSAGFNKQLFADEYRKDLLLGSVIFGAMLIGLWAIFSWVPTWVQSVYTDADVQQQRGLCMMVLASGGLAGSFFSGWIVNAIGLRKTMLACFAVCFVLTFFIFRITTSISAVTFIQLGILAFFFGISQGVLSVYIPQMFPTVVRASATGFCFNAGRLFTATVVFFIGALVSFLGGYGNALFIFSFVFIAGFIATWFDKKQHSL